MIMANNDRNRSSFYASDENWDQNQGRYRRDSDYQNQGNYGNVNYDRESDFNRNRGNYNTGYEGDAYRGNTSGGTNYGYMRDDYGRGQGSVNEGNWRNQGRGGMGYQGSQQGNYSGRNENYNRESYGNYGTGYGASGSYGSDYGTSGEYNYGTGGFQGQDRQRRQDYDQGHMNRDYGNVSGGSGSQYRGRDWDQQGYQGSGHYSGEDRGWWDKARDEVSSWFGNDDAERRRRMDEQKSAQHKGKGPRGYQRSDDRIREDVCDRLSDDPYLDASDIEVKVSGNEVILSGTVENREDKRRAEDVAERISGVKNVQNQLRVGHSSGQSSPVSNTGTGTASSAGTSGTTERNTTGTADRSNTGTTERK
jgi:osmotically-inducible protein OsmY